MIGSDRLSQGMRRAAFVPLVFSACVFCLAGFAHADNYIFTDRNADAYVLTKDYVSYSTNATGDDILTLNDMFGGNYLWVRRAGKEYVIRDAHAIRDANRLFAALDEVEPERAELRQARLQFDEDQSSLNTEKEEVESRLAALGGDDKSSSARVALEGQLAEFSAKRSALDDRASELDLRETEFESRVKSLQNQVVTSLWALIDRALANGLGEDSSRW